MKFSKSSWVVLVLGVVGIGAIMVGLIHSQQTQQQQDLANKIIASQQKLSTIKIDELTAAQNQLTLDKDLYTAQIADDKAKLAAPIDDISGTDIIIKSAHEFDLNIVNISSSDKSDTTLNGSKFTLLPFTVQVEGNTANVAGFVSNIKTLFPTSVVDTYQFTIGIPTPTPTPAPTPTTDVEAAPTPETTPTPATEDTQLPSPAPTTEQSAETPAATPEITPTPTPPLPINTAATITINIYDYKGKANVE